MMIVDWVTRSAILPVGASISLLVDFQGRLCLIPLKYELIFHDDSSLLSPPRLAPELCNRAELTSLWLILASLDSGIGIYSITVDRLDTLVYRTGDILVRTVVLQVFLRHIHHLLAQGVGSGKRRVARLPCLLEAKSNHQNLIQ